ncbi:hypothetical protein RSAG8_06163, partial [Rhizoctonia solani AG-8 WAC10335]
MGAASAGAVNCLKYDATHLEALEGLCIYHMQPLCVLIFSLISPVVICSTRQ